MRCVLVLVWLPRSLLGLFATIKSNSFSAFSLRSSARLRSHDLNLLTKHHQKAKANSMLSRLEGARRYFLVVISQMHETYEWGALRNFKIFIPIIWLEMTLKKLLPQFSVIFVLESQGFFSELQAPFHQKSVRTANFPVFQSLPLLSV